MSLGICKSILILTMCDKCFKINDYLNSTMNVLFHIIKEIKSNFLIFLFINANFNDNRKLNEDKY